MPNRREFDHIGNYNFKVEIEGVDGDGVVTSWMDTWLEEDRLQGKYHIGEGICSHKLYEKFSRDNFPYTESAGGIWSFHHFDKMFFSRNILFSPFLYLPDTHISYLVNINIK